MPYDQICALAEQMGISLDYIFLGRGNAAISSEGIDGALMEEVIAALTDETSELRFLMPADLVRAACLIYNQAQSVSDTHERKRIIPSAVMLLTISTLKREIQQNKDSDWAQKYPEIAAARANVFKEIMERLGGSADEESDEPTSVHQEIRGRDHQIAGRDVVNKGGKGSKKK